MQPACTVYLESRGAVPAVDELVAVGVVGELAPPLQAVRGERLWPRRSRPPRRRAWGCEGIGVLNENPGRW